MVFETSSDSGIDIKEYWRILLKRRWTVICIASAVILLVAVFTFTQRSVYRASTVIQIERQDPNILSFQEVLKVDASNVDFFQTQYKVLESRSLVKRVINELRLASHPEFASLRDSGLPEQEQESQLIDRLVRDHIKIRPFRMSRLVKLEAYTHDRELCARIANALANNYVELSLESRFEAAEDATQFLTEQIADLQATLEAKRVELQKYADENEMLTVEGTGTIAERNLAELNSAFTSVQAERIEKEMRYRELLDSLGLTEASWQAAARRGVLPPGLNLDSLPAVHDNGLVRDLKRELSELELRHSYLSQRFKPEWPELVSLRSQIDSLRQQVRHAEWRIVASQIEQSESDFRAAQANERQLAALLETHKTEVMELKSRAIQYATMKAEVETQQGILESLQSRKNEASVSARLKGLNTSNIRVVDPAEVPRGRYKPNIQYNMLLALLAGVSLGVFGAFFVDHLDNTIKSSDDIERYVGLPTLGVIPTLGGTNDARALPAATQARRALPAANTAPETVALVKSRSPVAEAYRSLRTSVLLSTAEASPRFVLVTSAQPGEGKTTTVVNLGITLAQAGRRVLIVDADLRKPRCHKVLGMSGAAGLTNYLAGNLELKDVVQPTRVPNLFLLASGPLPPNPSELLGGARLHELMHVLPPSVDHIVFDSPPVLTVTDPLLIGRLVDGVVLVVRSGRTPRELVTKSKRKLKEVSAKITGVVLNSLDAQHGDEYYYYYYSKYDY